jgi:hypothetical protein
MGVSGSISSRARCECVCYLERRRVLRGAEAGDVAVLAGLQEGLDLVVHRLGEDDACVFWKRSVGDSTRLDSTRRFVSLRVFAPIAGSPEVPVSTKPLVPWAASMVCPPTDMPSMPTAACACMHVCVFSIRMSLLPPHPIHRAQSMHTSTTHCSSQRAPASASWSGPLCKAGGPRRRARAQGCPCCLVLREAKRVSDLTAGAIRSGALT